MNDIDLEGLSGITRIVVIDEEGIKYERFPLNVRISVQDDGRTLKLFVKRIPPTKPIC